jgi:hypothetical protein
MVGFLTILHTTLIDWGFLGLCRMLVYLGYLVFGWGRRIEGISEWLLRYTFLCVNWLDYLTGYSTDETFRLFFKTLEALE